MGYRRRRTDLTAHLRGMRQLESAMELADMNGAELARAAGISTSWLGAIRTGQAPNISEEIALAIEHALGQRRGALFTYGASQELEGATP